MSTTAPNLAYGLESIPSRLAGADRLTCENRRKNYTHRLYVNDEDVKAKVAPRLAVLNPQDPVVTCIRRRALKFTGSMGSPDFELFSVNRYSVPHRVQPHTDASATPMLDSDTGRRFNRRTSFFVYVYASDDLEGGETFFPHISVPEKVDLENPAIISRHNASGALGLAAKPVSGSAIFWVGAKPDGTADQETLHEGLPVIKGEKMGMNIWARHYLD